MANVGHLLWLAALGACAGTPRTAAAPEVEPAAPAEPVAEPEPEPESEPPPAPAEVGHHVLPAMLTPTSCDAPGLRTQDFDLNSDGRPDVRKIYLPIADGGGDRLGCKLTDLDMTAGFDVAAIFDEAGQLYLEYMDLDFDGRADVMTAYDPHSGRAIMRARDTDFDGITDRIDPVDPAGGQP